MQARLNELYDAAKIVADTRGRIPAVMFTKLREALKECAPLRDVTEGDPERYAKIIAAATEIVASPSLNIGHDDLEIDPGANLSEGDDNGCWVSAWLWVPFAGTELDKEKDEVPVASHVIFDAKDA